MKTFKEYYLEEAESVDLEKTSKETIVSLLSSYSTTRFTISNVKITKNIIFDLEFTLDEKMALLKSKFSKQDFIENLCFMRVRELGMFIDADNIKIKNIDTDVKSFSSSGKSEYYIGAGKKVHVIITTDLQNIVSPESTKRMNDIMDNKISKMNPKKFETFEYVCKKIFDGYPQTLDYESYSDEDGHGFRLDPKNKFGSWNSNFVVAITRTHNIKSLRDIEGNPIKQIYINKLVQFFKQHYKVVDKQGRPAIANNFSEYLQPKVIVYIK